MSSGTIPTPEQNAQAIAQLTSTINVLVTQFIRPNAQQANANRESLDEVIDLLSRHASAIVEIDGQQEVNAQQIAASIAQIAANTAQIAAIGDRLEQFDSRLEDTRQLVAQNASDVAQLTVKQDRNAEQISELTVQISELTVKQDRNAEQISELTVKQDRNAEQIAELRTAQQGNAAQIEALAEASRTQLAGIIGNGRRIDRIEQQAS